MSFKTFFLLLALCLNFCFLQGQNLNFTSDLPLIFISTGEKEIPDAPKIAAEMGIIWHGDGIQNSTNELFNHYNGKISIEIRGSSSQMFPKKSYSFETKDTLNADMDFPLLGLPEEEDWILYAPYTDKSLIRNVLIFTLSEKLGHYTPRCRMAELFVNNEYQGVYVLMEKIKRDSNRIDIAKLKPEDLTGEDLTGGYIVKIDKTTGSGGNGWNSSYENSNQKYTYYQYEYPASDEIQQVQKQYIQNYINKFEKAVYNREYDRVTGYHQYIDLSSFVDFMIINEISKNIDGYRLSTYMFKDKNEKLNLGPIWDFNLAFGNANYSNAWETFGLEINVDLGNDNWQNPFWWGRFMGDRYFTKELRCRWDELSADLLSTDRIINTVDSLVNLLNGPSERNFQRWPVLGLWVWPNYYVGFTYMEEVSWLKNWITNRIYYLDQALPGICGGEIPVDVEGLTVDINPNPFTSKFTVQILSDQNYYIGFELFSINGKKIHSFKKSIGPGKTDIELNTETFARGVYIYRIYKGREEFEVGKIVKM